MFVGLQSARGEVWREPGLAFGTWGVVKPRGLLVWFELKPGALSINASAAIGKGRARWLRAGWTADARPVLQPARGERR